MWIDEFLHFAFGGLPNLSTALSVISTTTSAVNHGQTGTYFLLNYFSLKVFGADFLALRWPSIFSAFILLIFAAVFIWSKNLGRIWQFLCLLILGGQVGLMYFAGEARSYMPLAAAVVGALAYYSLSPSNRSSWPASAMGWTAVVLGVTMHPYFLMYWVAIIIFSFYTNPAVKLSRDITVLKEMFRFANPILVFTGSALGLTIGFFTWLREQPQFNRDPFEGLRTRGGFWQVLAETHLQFVPGPAPALAVLLAVLLASFLAIFWANLFDKWLKMKQLLPPLALLILAIALSGALSAISLANSYWILPRQWVASLAIAPIACVWLAGTAIRLLRQTKPAFGGLSMFFVALVIVISSINRLFNQFGVHQDEIAQYNLLKSQNNISALRSFPPPTTNSEWIILGNNNVLYEGPVWPEVSRYYGYEEDVTK